MALEFLFANKPQAKFDGFRTIEFDASISENHLYDARVTRNPIENGTVITDHVSINPIVLNMNGFITDTPVKALQGIRDRKEINGSGSFSKTAHKDLVDLFNARQSVTVTTGLDVYNNMILKKLTFPRDNKTGQAIRFTCELIQIQIATFETEELNDANISSDLNTDDQGNQKKTLGNKSAKQASPDAVLRTSFAVDIFDFAKTLF